MKLMKVFDCQDMPDDIRDDFFNHFEGVGNDVYIDTYVCDINEHSFMKWLIDNGAEENEKVLINHWW